MKMVQMNGVRRAEQMTLALTADRDQVVLALEAPAIEDGAHWLVYCADPDRIRQVAHTMLEAADLVEGKLADTGQYDADADNFREHRG